MPSTRDRQGNAGERRRAAAESLRIRAIVTVSGGAGMTVASTHIQLGPREVDPDVLLDIDDLTVAFPTEDGVVQAVRGVTYQLRRGECLGIVGESGSGKSVSSMAVMGLLPKTARITGSV